MKITKLQQNTIKQLAETVEASDSIVNRKLDSFTGRAVLWLHRTFGLALPKWAHKHMLVTRQLENAVKELRARQQVSIPNELLLDVRTPQNLAEALKKASLEEDIPLEILQTLEAAQQTVNKLAISILPKAMLSPLRQDRTYADQSKLLSGKNPISETRNQWHVNLGLLMNIYKRTSDPELKKKLSFLALNYLAKAAPINIREIGLDPAMTSQLEDLFQFGLFQTMCTYHRDVSTFEGLVREEFMAALPAKANEAAILILTDAKDLSILFPTKFAMLQTAGRDDEALKSDWASDLTQNFLKHCEKGNDKQDVFKRFLNPPPLLDLTTLLGDLITNKEGFEQKLAHYESLMDQAASNAVQSIKAQKPDLIKNSEDEKKLELFIRTNIICVGRTQLKGIGCIKVLPMFYDPKIYERYWDGVTDKERFCHSPLGEKDGYTKASLDEFVNLTGSRLGGVRGREQIFNFIDLATLLEKAVDTLGGSGQMVDYAPTGPNVLYFADKTELTQTALFKRFKSRFDHSGEIQTTPEHARVLGQSTIQLVEGLLNQIDQQKWNELNANPDTRQIVQTSLFRIMQHLAEAENRMDDFNTFAQAIELIHCEIATLLAMATPFKESDFHTIYKNQLDFIPPALSENVKVGITKSAMNVFAGINAAVKVLAPDLNIAHEAGSYYEEVGLIGSNRTTEEVLADPSIRRVDLYVGEFNHNINLDPAYSHYETGKVDQEIDKILAAKPETEHLTVAIDCTIDYIHSAKAEALLKKYSQQIQDGKLNLVFFRSGQKFDMLGMDNYYGATFYMVNNGGEQWKEFDALASHEAYKTDPLSIQWFCLVNQCAPQATDAYRKQIFENTRKTLERVPATLRPGGNPHIRISTVAVDMDACFLDIKITSPKISDRDVELLIHQTFAAYHAKIHSRGSFGFYHPNVNIIPDDKGNVSIRVNPGLNPIEVEYLAEFLQELEKKVNQAAS